MGLFDSITSKYPLPLPADIAELTVDEIQSAVFQTKDFENALDIYVINESGELFREERIIKWTEGNKEGKTFSERFGQIKTLKVWLELHKITKEVSFYQLFNDDKNSFDYWVEYLAVFVDGKVTSIKVQKFEATPNAERKARDSKWKAEMAATYEFRKKWCIRFLYLPYQSAVRWVFRKYNQIKQKLPPSYKIERFLTPL